MNFTENIHASFNILRQNKIRSFLTMLGIIIGIMAVIMIISVGNGAQGLILSEVQKVGSNLISIFPGSGDDEGPPVSVMGIVITTLKYDDIKALNNNPQAPFVEAVSGYVRGSTTAQWQGHTADTSFVGVSSALPNVEDTGVETGNFFSEEDEKTLQKVAVLGSDVARDLFDGQNPIGELVKINKHSFRVVGVMKERGSAGFSNQDNQIFIPITTAQKLLLGIDYISYGRVKAAQTDTINRTIEDVNLILQDRHNIAPGEPVDFDVRSQQDGMEALLKITNAVKFFLAAVAGIALIVGGIGIMNIMLVAVQERIREIGLRKAVGARNYHIMTQFLIETIVITSVAGITGILLGIGISFLIAQGAQFAGFEWKFSVSVWSIFLAVGVSATIGFLFGIIPARRASKLNPIEALRYE